MVSLTITNGPLHCIQGSLLHGVTHDGAVIEFYQCVGGGQRQDGLLSYFLNVNQNLAVRTVIQLVAIEVTRSEHERTQRLPPPLRQDPWL